MKKKYADTGFTLVEILIALGMAGILISAIYQIMVDQNRVYVIEEQGIIMQQDARAALDFTSRELRLAGLGVPDDNNLNTNVFPRLINNAKNVQGVDSGTDSIMFTANVGRSSVVVIPAAGDSKKVYVAPAPEEYFEFEGDSNRKSDTITGDMVDIINFLDGKKVRLNTMPVEIDCVSLVSIQGTLLTQLVFKQELYQVLSDEAKDKGLVPSDQIVVSPLTIWYRVRNKVLERVLSDDGGVTWKSTQSLINNVEDLQLAYAFDGNDADIRPDTDPPSTDSDTPRIVWLVDRDGQGALETEVLHCGTTRALSPIAYRGNTGEIPTSVSIGDPGFNPMRGIRLSLLLRSSLQNPDYRFRNIFNQPSVQDHTPAQTKKDGYRRRLYERELTFRNLGLCSPPG